MSYPALSLTGAHDLRDIADELLGRQRVEYVHDGELTFIPPAGFAHLTIVDHLGERFVVAGHTGESAIRWRRASENFQWDLLDGSRRFYIPDLAVARPGATTRREFRDNIALIVEVTSPEHPDSVETDRMIKPMQYAAAGVPLYLLVDQEFGSWTLHEVIDGWPRYQEISTGTYGPGGQPIALPRPFEFSIDTGDWPRLPDA
jgi:Uma2 family endonuclease